MRRLRNSTVRREIGQYLNVDVFMIKLGLIIDRYVMNGSGRCAMNGSGRYVMNGSGSNAIATSDK